MRGVNRVILVGNATRDAELRRTSTGKPVAHLRLATNRTVGGTADELQETRLFMKQLQLEDATTNVRVIDLR